MENLAENYTHIKGWGIDANPKNDPTYPMKHRTDEEQKGYNWDRPVQQNADVEVLHSNERPFITAVFGTTSPPSGLSGMIRRFAFKYSEDSFAHWIPLILADRVNVVEGVIDDFKRGHIPNIAAERGWTGEWKYNKKGFTQKVVVGVAVTTIALALLYAKNKKPKSLKNSYSKI